MPARTKRGAPPPEVQAALPPPPPADKLVDVPTVVDTFTVVKVQAKESELAADPAWTRVNLAHVVGINGINYGPGENILVPTASFEVWRHAEAKR